MKNTHNKPLKYVPAKKSVASTGLAIARRLCGRYGSSTMKHLSIIFLLLLSACSVVEIEDYIHEPTDSIRHAYIYAHYEKFDKLTNKEFLIVPNFRTFSKSFSSPYAKLLVLSKMETNVEIVSVELRSGHEKVTVPVGDVLEVAKSDAGTSYFFSLIIVVREGDLEMKYWNSLEHFDLVVTYRHGNEDVQQANFKLDHDVYKDIAWPT
jgi:hypothetical protein